MEEIRDAFRHMAVIEIYRERCPYCNFGEFYHNERRCRDCKFEKCQYPPTTYPTEEEIERAKNAMRKNPGK